MDTEDLFSTGAAKFYIITNTINLTLINKHNNNNFSLTHSRDLRWGCR